MPKTHRASIFWPALWLPLVSAGACVVIPGQLDAGLDGSEVPAETTGDGDGDGDADTDADADTDLMDGETETTGDGDPMPLDPCQLALDLEGDAAALPKSVCTMSCDDDFEWGETLELMWSMDGDGDGAHNVGLLANDSGIATVDWRAQAPARLRTYALDAGLATIHELDIEGEIYASAMDNHGQVFVAYPDKFDAELTLHVAAFAVETGERLWHNGYADSELHARMASAPDGFVVLFEANGQTIIHGYVHDIPEPVWSSVVPLSDGQAVDIAADGTIAVSGLEDVAFFDPDGNLLDSFPHVVDRVAINAIAFATPTTILEAADGHEQGNGPSETVDALLTAQSIDGAFFTQPYRWGDLDCEGELVPGDDRFLDLAQLEDGSVVAVGEEAYPFHLDTPTSLARISQIASNGSVIGSVRLAIPNARATSVLASGNSFYVVIQEEHSIYFDFQVRKYRSAL